MDNYNKVYNLTEINRILEEIGGGLEKQTDIIAVGGYCMLVYKARDSTQDIDFIPSESEFAVPTEYAGVVSADILNIWELSLDYRRLKPYCRQTVEFGKLTVHLADYELLLAMKFVARERRTVLKDAKDIEWLSYRNINRKRAFVVYKLITALNPPFNEWSNDIDTEVFLVRAEKKFGVK